MQVLRLNNNEIGDEGMRSLSDALVKGALVSLKALQMDDGPLGSEHPALKAACDARGIDLDGL